MSVTTQILIGVVVAVGALILVPVAIAGRPELGAIDLSRPGVLVLRPLGYLKLLALARSVEVPLDAVTDARAVERRSLPLGLRVVGTGIPGAMRAGRFRAGGTWQFWLTGRSQQVLAIGAAGSGSRFGLLVVQVPDPVAAAETIRTAAGLT